MTDVQKIIERVTPNSIPPIDVPTIEREARRRRGRQRRAKATVVGVLTTAVITAVVFSGSNRSTETLRTAGGSSPSTAAAPPTGLVQGTGALGESRFWPADRETAATDLRVAATTFGKSVLGIEEPTITIADAPPGPTGVDIADPHGSTIRVAFAPIGAPGWIVMQVGDGVRGWSPPDKLEFKPAAGAAPGRSFVRISSNGETRERLLTATELASGSAIIPMPTPDPSARPLDTAIVVSYDESGRLIDAGGSYFGSSIPGQIPPSTIPR